MNEALAFMFFLGVIVPIFLGTVVLDEEYKYSKHFGIFSLIWFIVWSGPAMIKLWITGVLG